MAFRRWTYVINNYAAEERDHIASLEHPDICYQVLQFERGDKGTPHLQGYLELPKPRRIGGVKRILSCPSAHLEPAKGTAEQNLLYCTKDPHLRPEDTPFMHIYGTPITQGQRTDLKEFKIALMQGKSNRELWEAFFPSMMRYHKAVEKYREDHLSARDPNDLPIVEVHYGVPGTGKTRYVYQIARLLGLTIYEPVAPNGSGQLWWSGYEQQDIILLDDFYGWMPWATLLRLLDRYPMKVQSKGSQIQVKSKYIFITSNAAPNEWYKMAPGREFAALARRCTKIILYNDEPGTPFLGTGGNILRDEEGTQDLTDYFKCPPGAAHHFRSIE